MDAYSISMGTGASQIAREQTTQESEQEGNETMTKDGSRKTYVCRKLRIYIYLTERGFKPYRTVPDMRDPNRLVWLYEDSDEIRDAVEEYYKGI